MPLIQRKRRAPVEEPESEEEVEAGPSRRNGARVDHSPVSEDVYKEDDVEGTGSADSVDNLARKLVRYALSCEYSRQPIRRSDIGQKVLSTSSRQFKIVFTEAQIMLQNTFGMEMTELPMRENITVADRRAAQKREKASTSTNAWVLTSILPPKYRIPEILAPPRIPTETQESSYVGLYTFIIAIISLAGGQLPEAKLERQLKRTNADQSTPVDKTEKLLQRLIKEGYILKIKENIGGEEQVSYRVGPRGKVEVSDEVVAEFVRRVYGQKADEELDKKLDRSLGLGQRRAPAEVAATTANGGSNGKGKGRKRAQRAQTEDDEPEEDEDEDEDEEMSDG